MSAGYTGVRRWTKKVLILASDLLNFDGLPCIYF